MGISRWVLDCVSGDALAPGPRASARLPAMFMKPSGGPGLAGLGKGAPEENSASQVHVLSRRRKPRPSPRPSPRLPSALQVLCVFMKLRAQLQRCPPLVLLQSCEQVPKRRHSLMSGGYTPGSGRVSRRGLLPAAWAPPSYPGIRAGLAPCGSQCGTHSRRLSQCARSGPRPRRCWRWWRSSSAWGLRRQ